MRNFNAIIRSLLGASAFFTLVACEEVDPSEVAQQRALAAMPVACPAPPPAPIAAPPTLPEKATTVTPPPALVEERPPRALITAARDALSTGELDRALRLAKAAVQRAPSSASAWNTLGRVQRKAGQRAESIVSFERAIDADPAAWWAHSNLGLALVDEKRYEDAVEELRDATRLGPASGDTFHYLAVALERLHRIDEARVAYQRAADRDQPEAVAALARLDGVRSIRAATANADTWRSDSIPTRGVELPPSLDGNLDGGVR